MKTYVVIPAHNEAARISHVLADVRSHVPDYGVIVVDDGSTDNTVKLAKDSGAKVFERAHFERSIQRNFGASKAKVKYLLFLDADMELSPRVAAECVNKVGMDEKLGALVIPEESVAKNFWEKVKAFERSFYNLEGDSITDAARFLTREAFNSVGGYDEKIIGPEDWDLPDSVKSKGYKIGRIDSRIFHHERISSPFKVARKKFYYGLKSHRYLKKQKLPTISAKTLYFLRPAFYRNWPTLLLHPILSTGMFVMLTIELIYGGAGFFLGKLLNK